MLDATAAVLVQLEGGGGRVMGDYGAGATIEPITGSPAEIADQLTAFGDAGVGTSNSSSIRSRSRSSGSPRC